MFSENKKSRKYLRVGLLLFLLFMGIWGCLEDIPNHEPTVSEDETLIHWMGTHNPMWNSLLMEKIAKYDHPDSLAIAYARDLKILLYAEKFYREQLSEIYGNDSVYTDDFLYGKWEKLSEKLREEDFRQLDYNVEWNLYRKLYYSVKLEERTALRTRSDEIVVMGCDFARVVNMGLSQLNLSDPNYVADRIYRGWPVYMIFGDGYAQVCDNVYERVLFHIRWMVDHSGSSYIPGSCESSLRDLNRSMEKFVECIKMVETKLKDNPLPPGTYYPPYPGGGSGGGVVSKDDTMNYHVIYTDCGDSSVYNGMKVTDVYHLFEQAAVRDSIYIPWLASDRSLEWGTVLYKENNIYKLTPTTIGSATSCPLRGCDGAIAVIHTHPKGSGPSLQDLIHLVSQCKLSDGMIKDSYIFANDDHIYNLHLMNFEKAMYFFSVFSKEGGRESLENFIQEHTDIMEQQRKEVDGEFVEHEYQLFALALLLNEKDAGVVLVEQSYGAFQQLGAKIAETRKNGIVTKRVIKTRCKY